MATWIDAHAHVWRADLNCSPTIKTIVSPASEVPIELLLEYMEEHDVSRAVLVQPIYPGDDNSYVADCARAYPDRFCAVCVVDPRDQDFEKRLSYWVEERGCRGLRLRPRIKEEAEMGRNLIAEGTGDKEVAMLLDLKKRRRTEAESTIGLIVKKAQEAGIPVPYTECAWRLIHSIESAF